MPDDPPRIVLVVDDDSAIGENLAVILEMEGYECWLAHSADAALRRLELELRSPDVILLDLVMPGMSVRRFISHLKDRATWARAPIILATAASLEDIPPDLQVDARLRKPFSIERLLELVRGCVHQPAGPTMPNLGE
jgi:DNA-binding response OmpR family regulator